MNQIARTIELPVTRAPFGWQVVVACVIGSALSPATLINVPFSLFVTELQQAFGWSRSQITGALSLFLCVLVVSLPLAGRLVDRLGARRVAIPSILLYGAALVSMGWLGPSLAGWYVMYALLAVLGAGAQSLTFIRVISAWFDRRRGLVIGICMAGFGLGYVAVPMIAQSLIAIGGWRLGYVGLGLLALLGALPIVTLLLRDSPAQVGLHIDGQVHDSQPALHREPIGVSLAGAMRTREFWVLAATFLLMSFALNGVQSQIVPMLTDRGMSAASAAIMLSAIGVGSFPGRLVVGFTIDRVFAPYVAFVCYAAAAVAILWLMEGSGVAGVFICAVAVGVALGAENDLLGYLVGRYFGLRWFGQIYGALLSVYLIGAALGAYLSAQVYSATASYHAALQLDAAAIIGSCGLLLFLRRYDRGERTQ
ncbi:MFS transporter [Steroidobacter flavus]|uniref:MFS transporter n=1 Tax=Steroidobacter flavus TaxID=1842136 RepID=A0ABV8T3T3_9GAMM